jgi:chromosome segregation ATPase
MRNFTLLLVLISGLLSGYLVGNYRGRNAREALQKAVETGKTIEAERETAISKLKMELNDINAAHRRELEAMRKENDSRIAIWRHNQSSLDEQIKRATANLAAADTRLSRLIIQRNGASAADASTLDPAIERVRAERDRLRREIDGNTCLHTPVPDSVFEAFNATNGQANAR